jgi:hypothetical protein
MEEDVPAVIAFWVAEDIYLRNCAASASKRHHQKGSALVLPALMPPLTKQKSKFSRQITGYLFQL